MPGGQPIGSPGSSSSIRELPGGTSAANELFNQLRAFGTEGTPPTYPGMGVQLPGGGFVGLRPMSRSGDTAIDVKVPDIPFTKIHFP
jgi:hypothetical protein